MPAPLKFTNEQIITALKETMGLVYLAAKRLGCNPSTIFNRANKFPTIRQVIDDERGHIIDEAELKLHNAILKEEPWAIQLALRTLGRNRGYVERQEQQQIGRVNVQLVWPEEMEAEEDDGSSADNFKKHWTDAGDSGTTRSV